MVHVPQDLAQDSTLGSLYADDTELHSYIVVVKTYNVLGMIFNLMFIEYKAGWQQTTECFIICINWILAEILGSYCVS